MLHTISTMCQLNLYKIGPNVIPDLIRDPLLASGGFRVKPGMTANDTAAII
ncbi:MAG: hypothetical protein FWF85_06810 [Clostridiales bacterium]|nr:hypothetical protein [Clostridiales bacterium]MDR2711532.1 hypothetical protein [Clostridiales bacterium]